ncbi:hypothetical protein GW17_00051343, partial [Ensete ventricosum]
MHHTSGYGRRTNPGRRTSSQQPHGRLVPVSMPKDQVSLGDSAAWPYCCDSSATTTQPSLVYITAVVGSDGGNVFLA